MSGSAPEIPGFQPLQIRGGGELGIWIEARQVRLDRRVLLKVLPAGEAHLANDFQREVRGMVQLDGRGSLRVIEEGQAGQARFVAMDEAGSVRADPELFSEEDIYPLASMLISLYLESIALGFRPGRIPVESLLRLPAGGFVVCELGKIQSVSSDADMEEHRSPIAETLRRWSRHLGLAKASEPLLEELRQEQFGLEEIRTRWRQSAEVVKRRPTATTRVQIPMLMALGICLVLLLLLSNQLIDQRSEISKELEVGSGESSSSESGFVGENEVSGDRNSEVVTSNNGEGDSGNGVEAPRDDSGSSGELNRIKDAPIPVSEDDWEVAVAEDQAWQLWRKIHSEVDPGNLIANRQELLNSPLGMNDSNLIRRALLWQESKLLRSLNLEIKSAVTDDQIENAKRLLAEASTLLPERSFEEEENRIAALQLRQLELQKRWSEQQCRTIESLLGTGALGDSDRFGFTELSVDHPIWVASDRFKKSVKAALGVHDRVLLRLRNEINTGKDIEVSLKNGRRIKGKVLAVTSGDIEIKPQGRREGTLLKWSDLDRNWSRSWLVDSDDIDPEQIKKERAMLSMIWGGLEKVDAGELPEGLIEPLRVAAEETRRWRRIDGFNRLKEEEPFPSRDRVEALVKRFPSTDWAVGEKSQLEEWWISPGFSNGPSDLGLFPGASELIWREGEEGFELEVRWDTGEGIVQDWGNQDTGEIRTVRRGGVLLRGDIPLETPLSFEQFLTLQLEGSVTFREKPNFNVVFWTGGEVPVIFGLGLRPPERASFTSAGETVLLPAHGIFKATEIKLPDTKVGEGPLPFPLPIVAPRLDPGDLLKMELIDLAAETVMTLGGEKLLQLPGEARPRRGGVAFSTFESPIMIKGIRLNAGVSSQQWRALLLEKARKTLWNGQ